MPAVVIGRRFASRYGFIPRSTSYDRFLEALTLERIGNEHIAEAVATHPDRLVGLVARGDRHDHRLFDLVADVCGVPLCDQPTAVGDVGYHRC